MFQIFHMDIGVNFLYCIPGLHFEMYLYSIFSLAGRHIASRKTTWPGWSGMEICHIDTELSSKKLLRYNLEQSQEINYH